MNREEIAVLAQLLSGIKDSIEKLEEAKEKRDAEGFNLAKKEILDFQKQIDRIL